MKKKRFVFILVILLLQLSTTGSSFADTFKPILDEFWIVKDSAEIFRDSFADDIPPPNGPDGADTYSMYGADGITSETGGKLTMTPSLGEPTAITTTHADLSTSGMRKFATNNNDPNFLGFDSSFEIHGLYDMANTPMVSGQSFGIRASDRALVLGNEGDNTFYLFVGFSSITGEVSVILRMHDFTSNTSEVLWSKSIASLLLSADQIELVLSKDAESDMLNASYHVYDFNNNILGSGSKDSAGFIYNNEEYIRAQFTSTEIVPVFVDNTVLLEDVFCGSDDPDVPCCGLKDPRGLRFGPDGNLYVTSYYDIQKINGTSGECLGKFNHGEPEAGQQLLDPSDLIFYTFMTFPSSTSLFVADYSHKRVVRYNGKTGEYISDLIGGSTASPYGYVIPTNFEIGPKTLQPFPYPELPGDLYIRNNYGNIGIDSFDPSTGAFLQRIVHFGSSTYPSHFVVGPDQDIYILAQYTDTSGEKWFIVQRNDGHTGTSIDRFISLPAVSNQLCLPAPAPAPGPPLSCSLDSLDSLSFGPDGNLYIKGGRSGGSTYILRFDGTTGKSMDSFAWVSDAKMQYSYGDMIWGQDGKLYVVDRLGNKIRRYWGGQRIECPDTDEDNICDIDDNCPNNQNPGQIDRNQDGEGDVCDDSDGDGVVDALDKCWQIPDGQNDIDSDGMGDDCDPDIDGDGIANVNDFCPYDHNNDSDGDSICDDIDPCLGDLINDFDNDGLCSFEDNCPYTYNPSQSDDDFDEVGNDCDRCPGQDDGLDFDGDTMPDCLDNCYRLSNLNQDDADADGVGDACDCDDLILGPYEEGIDCGGSACSGQQPCLNCTWCGNYVKPLFLAGGPTCCGKIDVVFVPERSYQGNLSQFEQDVIEYIRNGFLQIPNMAVNPIWDPDLGPPNLIDIHDTFNFYLYTGGFAATGDCSGYLPGFLEGASCWLDCYSRCTTGDLRCIQACRASCPSPLLFWNQAPFTDVAAILFNGVDQGCSDSLSPPTHFIASEHYNVVIHEAAHAIFGLVDEYCGCTHYTQNDRAPNVWDNLNDCQTRAANQGWTLGTCREIKCQKICGDELTDIEDWWRYDPDTPDPDFMTACGSGLSVDYTFYEADTNRINYVIKNWPRGNTKGILSTLYIDNGTITEFYSEVVDSHPDIGLQEGPFGVEALSSAGEILDFFEIWDPRIKIGAQGVGPGQFYKENVVFKIIFPFYDNLNSFTVKDVETGETLIKVDLTETLKNHCVDNDYEGSECQSLDWDNDGTPDFNDGCPEDQNKTEPGICGCGVADIDLDGDGYYQCNDCDDSAPDMNPGEYELPGNYIDENCDGSLGACDPNIIWKNHGKFVSCVVHETKNLVEQGILTKEEGNAIIKSVAQSNIGKK